MSPVDTSFSPPAPTTHQADPAEQTPPANLADTAFLKWFFLRLTLLVMLLLSLFILIYQVILTSTSSLGHVPLGPPLPH
jgi:hypothetical protein